MPSVYILCRTALLTLLEGLDQEPERLAEFYGGQAGVFTTNDALPEAANWTAADHREAIRQMQNIAYTLYKGGRVVRFGPVEVPGHPDDRDYLRSSSGIVYARPDGPARVKTPNGIFNRLRFIDDPGLLRPGRKAGIERNDFKPWGSQDPSLSIDRHFTDAEARQEIERLTIELQITRTSLERAVAENERLRSRAAKSLNPTEIRKLIAEELERRQAA